MLREIFLATTMSLAPAFAATQHIAYTGGVQTGVVHLKGTRQVPGSALPDTLVFDGGPRVAVFAEAAYNIHCGLTSLGYWFFLENASRIGVRKTLDTVWTTTTTFPSTPLSLDTLRPYPHPVSGVSIPQNLAQAAWGIQVGQKRTDEICVSYEFLPRSGFKRMVYFSWMKDGQTRYGKLMARSLGLYTSTGPIITHPTVELDSVEVAYTLFDSTNLDPTPMALRSASPSRSAGVNLVWQERDGVRLRDARGRLFDLHGRRLPEARPVPSP